MLTAYQEKKALSLLAREERKEAARVKLYAELRAKRQRWTSKWVVSDIRSATS